MQINIAIPYYYTGKEKSTVISKDVTRLQAGLGIVRCGNWEWELRIPTHEIQVLLPALLPAAM